MLVDFAQVARNLVDFLLSYPYGWVCLVFLLLIGPCTWVAAFLDSRATRRKLRKTARGYAEVAQRLNRYDY